MFRGYLHGFRNITRKIWTPAESILCLMKKKNPHGWCKNRKLEKFGVRHLCKAYEMDKTIRV